MSAWASASSADPRADVRAAIEAMRHQKFIPAFVQPMDRQSVIARNAYRCSMVFREIQRAVRQRIVIDTHTGAVLNRRRRHKHIASVIGLEKVPEVFVWDGSDRI